MCVLRGFGGRDTETALISSRMTKHQLEALERAKDVIRWVEAGSAPTDAQLFGLSAIQG